MPSRPRRPCQHPGCGVLSHATYCDRHTTQRHRERQRRRGTTTQRGYGADWQRLRDRKVAANPLCEECLTRGETSPAEEVDHIIPIERRPDLRLVWDNLQSLCSTCHARKTAHERGGGWAARPKGLRPSNIPLTIVTGPPGAGKSTYVEQAAGPNDLVLDLDRFRALVVERDPHLQWDDGSLYKAAMRERNLVLRQLARDKEHDRAWFIVSAPKATDRQWWQDTLKPDKIILLEVEPGECERRIRQSRTGDRMERSIKGAYEWWEQYAHRSTDVIIRPAARNSCQATAGIES